MCRHCEHSMNSQDTQCLNCEKIGSPILLGKETICRHCGYQVDLDYQYCKNCGNMPFSLLGDEKSTT